MRMHREKAETNLRIKNRQIKNKEGKGFICHVVPATSFLKRKLTPHYFGNLLFQIPACDRQP
jgi:hypothetical protein